jgi:polysaccharide export outer membrane protein
VPQQAPSNLVGVQHYMESVGAGSTDDAVTTSVPFESPPANQGTPVRVARPSTAPARSEQPVPNSAAPSRPAVPDDANRYRLGPGDQIDVHVWRNPELTRSVPVRPDGIISLPLAGELMASGKTVAELEREITAVLGEYVQYPTVTVSVTEVRGMVVYVVGRVASPGTLQLDRPINIIQAIAMAGGMQEFADRNGVVVIRTVNGRETRLRFRYGDALKGKSDEVPIILQSGDVIYVP